MTIISIARMLVTALIIFSWTDTEPMGKINGVNIVSPVYESNADNLKSIEKINANWISICPWAFMIPGDPNIYYNTTDNYWGDRPENMKLYIEKAKAMNRKILLKPHVWVNGSGWPGDLLFNETGWYFWELNYASFMLEMARFSEEHKVDMLCIGVEFKSAVNHRPEFWNTLIESIREVYSGKLTYAANWDNYHMVKFWPKLDYIGIDAYFPLSAANTPDKQLLKRRWAQETGKIEKISNKYNKKVIFTEYGYRSVDKTAWQQWEIEHLTAEEDINLQAQLNAYEGLFESVWHKYWFAGGFIWKWYIDRPDAGGENNSGYTPQNKPVETLIRKWYTE